MPSRCFMTLYASLRVPQCSVFSILAPFSAHACSSVVRTFLISSSGVAGRTIKTRSYKRSSMMTSFLPVPGTRPGKNKLVAPQPREERFLASLGTTDFASPLLLQRRDATVIFIHGRRNSFLQNRFNRVACHPHHLGGQFELGLFHRPQNVVGQIAHRMIRPATQTEARKFGRAYRGGDRLRTVVRAGAAAFADANHAPGQIALIEHD